MRTAVACFVLAAAIATPGIVVAATASSHESRFTTTLVSGTLQAGPPPIDPALQPAARAVKNAFAAKGVQLTALPAGPGTVAIVEPRSSRACSVFIVLRLDYAPPFSAGPPCPTKGAGVSHGLAFSYTPGSVGPTIEQALSTLPR
jgi:hypothetical protein